MTSSLESITQPTDRKATTGAHGFMQISACTLNALTRDEIVPAALATVTALLSFTERRNGKRVGHPFRRTIAARTGQSLSTVTDHLRQLQDAGLVTIDQDPFGGPNRYELIDPCGSCFDGSKEANETARPLPASKETPTSQLRGVSQPAERQGSKASSPKPTPKGSRSASRSAANSETVTNPSPDKLDPTDCAHLNLDDGYCSPCGSQVTPDPRYPDEQSQLSEVP